MAVMEPSSLQQQLLTMAPTAPLSRPIFIYLNTASMARPEVNEFVNFYLENAGVLASEVGYIALPDDLYQEAKDKISAL